jgi:hypothetical protein
LHRRTEQNNNALLLQVLGDTTRHCTLISDPPRYRPFARNRRGKPNVTRAPLSHTKGSAACPVSPVDTGRFEGPEASSRGGAWQPPHGDKPGAPPHSRVGGIPNLQSRPSRLHPLSTCGSIQAARPRLSRARRATLMPPPLPTAVNYSCRQCPWLASSVLAPHPVRVRGRVGPCEGPQCYTVPARQRSDVQHVQLDAHIQQTSARRSSTPILSGTLQLRTFILIQWRRWGPNLRKPSGYRRVLRRVFKRRAQHRDEAAGTPRLGRTFRHQQSSPLPGLG